MLTPPEAAKIATERVHHGDHYVDNYEWMRDKESPDTLAHLHAENAFTAARTSHLSVLQEQIFEEIKSRTQETDLSVPVRRGQWWYFSRTEEGKQYPIHCRAPIADADDWTPPTIVEPAAGDTGTDAALTPATLPGEQILLDDNVEAEGHDFFSLGSFSLSDDGTLLLYGVDVEGDERYTLRVRQVGGSPAGSAGASASEADTVVRFSAADDLADEIPGTASGALLDATGKYIFYTTVDDAWRPDTVWRYELGTAAASAVQVFHEPDESFWVGVGRSRSGKYLAIEAGSRLTSETRLLDTSDPTGDFEVVWPREVGVEYDVEHVVVGTQDRLLIVHNKDAINFELVSVAAAEPLGERRVILPHNEAVRLEGVDAFKDFVAIEYRREGLTRVAIAIVPKHGGRYEDIPHELKFDDELFTVGLSSNPEWNQPSIRLSYGSFVTPTIVYDYLVDDNELVVRKQQPVLGRFDPALYTQRREWATASDGTRVPISLVYRNDLVAPGTPAPTVLYGYGSYEISIDPSFTVGRLSLLDRGMVFAVAHVRGGGELGRTWYEGGKKLHKRNTFTDFVACARHLIDIDVTSSDRLVAEGGSAGGLLMGAVANLAPQLFSGILAVVPFVDPLTSILDPSLPLTVIEWDEWGDPLHNEEVYHYMKSYSPLENVHDVHYPRILAVTSLNDTRVLYVEPAKWVARLREVGADALLKTEMAAGHGGVSGRYDAWRERAFNYAWMVDVTRVSL
ncbi:S9 family peptidase [uncultured Salinibacterium sp.]|uniref:S9 family peptidase n=1 Tax=uncultured Salinibacterium sp. TaxID=459274 RepID=UPI0030DC82A1|tara:strand:- start:148643 stop:150853 length:2211 start_codon:yes stop_codon:yes gene_type:complete